MIKVYSEMTVDEIVFRAHPNYQSDGPWYDWCLVNFQIGESDLDDEDFPAKLVCLFIDEEGKSCALVHSVVFRSHETDNDSLTCQK